MAVVPCFRKKVQQACCSWQVLEDKPADRALMKMWVGMVGRAHNPLEMEICSLPARVVVEVVPDLAKRRVVDLRML